MLILTFDDKKEFVNNKKELYGESETLFYRLYLPKFLLFLEKLFGKYFVL